MDKDKMKAALDDLNKIVEKNFQGRDGYDREHVEDFALAHHETLTAVLEHALTPQSDEVESAYKAVKTILETGLENECQKKNGLKYLNELYACLRNSQPAHNAGEVDTGFSGIPYTVDQVSDALGVSKDVISHSLKSGAISFGFETVEKPSKDQTEKSLEYWKNLCEYNWSRDQKIHDYETDETILYALHILNQQTKGQQNG